MERTHNEDILKTTTSEVIVDYKKGLDVLLQRSFASGNNWFETITDHVRWYRVQYASHRFGKKCETPCYTAFFGGYPQYSPYEPIPSWLKPLIDRVSTSLGGVPFNACLFRLYFDGNDEIAWHTDGRKFLENDPIIASLSFGARATFQMRRMHNVWPPCDGSSTNTTTESYIDTSTPIRTFVVGDGDLLVMRGPTQKHWHHRVPKEKGRRPRLNINFRYIRPGFKAEAGQKTYYKYMVHGDEEAPKSWLYKDILKRNGGMLKFCGVAHGTIGMGNQETVETDRTKPAVKCSTAGSQKENCAQDYLTTTNNRKKKTGDGCSPSEQQDFLFSNEDVDATIFLSLPSSLQHELISSWRVDQVRPDQYKRKGKEDPSTCCITQKTIKRRKTNNFHRKGDCIKGPLDSFFRSSGSK